MKLIFTSQPNGYLTLKFELTTFTSVMFSMMSERERINWILRQRLVIFCEWEVSLLSARRRLSANWQEGDNRKLNISKHNFNQSIYSFSLLFTSNFRCTQLPSGMILIYKMNLAVKNDHLWVLWFSTATFKKRRRRNCKCNFGPNLITLSGGDCEESCITVQHLHLVISKR